MDSGKDAKSRELQSWTAAAPGWRKHDARIIQMLGTVSARMLDKAQVREGHAVLDVACGTGEPAIPAAQRVGPNGQVLAVDAVAAMVEFAREKADAAKLENIEFRVMDGEELALPAGIFEAATMRFGLMFMPAPVACLQSIRRALKRGARLALATWAGPDKNPWASVPLTVLRRYVDLPAPVRGQPGIFAFADPAYLQQALAAAGFREIGVEALDVLWAGPESGRAFFGEMIDLAGPLAAVYATLSDADRRSCADAIAAEVERRSVRAPGVALPGVAWIATGRS